MELLVDNRFNPPLSQRPQIGREQTLPPANLFDPVRRAWLRGMLAAGLSLRGLPTQQTQAAPTPASLLPGFGRAKSVIFLMTTGGQSQIDTWDPKPLAPAEVRGEFAAIDTALPGIHFCEHLPQMSRMLDRCCLVRSMSHEDLDHGSAFYLTMTGRYHRQRSANPLPAATDLPTLGGVLHRLRPHTGAAQTAVHLNGPAEVPNIIGAGQTGGFLGKGFDPLVLGDVTSEDLAIPSLQPLDELTTARMQRRQHLQWSLDQLHPLHGETQLQEHHSLYLQALQLLEQPTTRSAFDLSQEPTEVRDRYGRYRAGQACLLARRLVEAGVPWITVFWSHNNRGQDRDPSDLDLYGWDTHNDIFDSLRNPLLPRFDHTFSALLEDLDQRGLLDQTLVVCIGEFGRAPLVALEKNFLGSSPGRKHWSWVYSALFAGAGVQRGSVLGASDERGAYPVSTAYGPWDVAATVLHALGIDPQQHYFDLQSRPYTASDGEVIAGLYC